MNGWQLHVNVFRTLHIIAIWGQPWVWNPPTMIAHRLQQHYKKPCWLSGHGVTCHTMSLEPWWWAWWPNHHDMDRGMLNLWWGGSPFGSPWVPRTDHPSPECMSCQPSSLAVLITCRTHPTICNSPPPNWACKFSSVVDSDKMSIMQVVLLKSRGLTWGHVFGNG